MTLRGRRKDREAYASAARSLEDALSDADMLVHLSMPLRRSSTIRSGATAHTSLPYFATTLLLHTTELTILVKAEPEIVTQRAVLMIMQTDRPG
jgi:hypothetical protein